jgi:hypothetical protein
MSVKSAVQVPAEVAELLAFVSSSGPVDLPCDGAADLSAVEQPPC